MEQFSVFLSSVIAFSVAGICGALIGFERLLRQKTAGLRTNTIVSIGAAIFVDLGLRMKGVDGSVHIVAYVVSGVGFLGAGTIMKEGATIRGLTTAATLWGSASVGACAGAHFYDVAALATFFILLANLGLQPISKTTEKRLNLNRKKRGEKNANS